MQGQAHGGEPIAVTPTTLRKRLNEKGLLLSTEEKRETLTIRRTVEGVQRNVLHLGKDFLFSDTPEPDKPDTEQKDPHSNEDSGAASVSGSPERPERPDPGPDLLSGSGTESRVTDAEPDSGDRLSDAEN